MSNIEQIKEKIRQSGLKVTLQRIAVMEALMMLKNHPTADMVLEYINRRYPAIATGTVYKTLDTFTEKGLIEKIKTDADKMRYDAFTQTHHHIYDPENNEIADYYDSELDKLLSDYFAKKGISNFEIQDIKLQITGKRKSKPENTKYS